MCSWDPGRGLRAHAGDPGALAGEREPRQERVGRGRELGAHNRNAGPRGDGGEGRPGSPHPGLRAETTKSRWEPARAGLVPRWPGHARPSSGSTWESMSAAVGAGAAPQPPHILSSAGIPSSELQPGREGEGAALSLGPGRKAGGLEERPRVWERASPRPETRPPTPSTDAPHSPTPYPSRHPRTEPAPNSALGLPRPPQGKPATMSDEEV